MPSTLQCERARLQFHQVNFEGMAAELDDQYIDILPALKDGDSYGVLQAIHLEESLRWVPASSEMHALPLRAWHG